MLLSINSTNRRGTIFTCILKTKFYKDCDCNHLPTKRYLECLFSIPETAQFHLFQLLPCQNIINVFAYKAILTISKENTVSRVWQKLCRINKPFITHYRLNEEHEICRYGPCQCTIMVLWRKWHLNRHQNGRWEKKRNLQMSTIWNNIDQKVKTFSYFLCNQ